MSSKIFKDNVKRLIELIELEEDPFRKYEYPVNVSVRDLLERYKDLNPGEHTEDYYHVAGRISAIRSHGGIIFADLKDDTGKVQLLFRKDVLSEKKFHIAQNLLVLGDVIGVYGNVMKTRRGELSINVKDFEVLSITLRGIPHQWYGIKDIAKRYEQRYLDFMLNDEARRIIKIVSKIKQYFREFLNTKDFIEIYTPKLQQIYGGALARPFVTELWATKDKVYLSISPETYLKRLVVGQFYKVYEITPCFRNEDIDATHNPEFEQIEIYQAFIDWKGIMKLTEDMISYTIKQIFGDYKIEVGDKTLDFKPPWERLPMEEAIKRETGIDVSKLSFEELKEIAEKDLEITDEEKISRKGKIIEELFEKYVQPKITNPTFITLFKRDVSPLAKPHRENPEYVERFEIYINGLEVGNGYSEQNNPFLQYLAFKEEEELRKRVKKEGLEYMPMDKDYVRALEYGLPPTGGVGIGIQRLAMAILGINSIKEVIAFPYVKIGNENITNIAEEFPELIDYYLGKISKEELAKIVKSRVT